MKPIFTGVRIVYGSHEEPRPIDLGELRPDHIKVRIRANKMGMIFMKFGKTTEQWVLGPTDDGQFWVPKFRYGINARQ